MVIAGTERALKAGSVDPAVVAIEARRAVEADCCGRRYRRGLSRFDRPKPRSPDYDELLAAR